MTQSELGTESLDPHVVDPDGNIYGTIGISATSFVKIDADTMQVLATRGFGSNVQLDIASAYTLIGRIDFVLGLSFLGATARVFYADTLLQFWEGQGVSTRPRGVVAGLSDFGACEAWFAVGAPTATVNVLHVRVEMPFTVSVVDATPAVVKPKLITLAAADFGAAQMTIGNLCYDEENDRVLFFTLLDGVSHFASMDSSGTIAWIVPASGDMPSQARYRNGKIYIIRSGGVIDVRSADDGSLISSQSGFTGTNDIIRFDPAGAMAPPGTTPWSHARAQSARDAQAEGGMLLW